jgi:tetrahydrodipicolinate N-succinyltransferase
LGKQSFVTRRNNKTIREVIELLDSGKLRVAEPKDAWQVNEWVKESSCYVFNPKNGNMGSWNFLIPR